MSMLEYIKQNYTIEQRKAHDLLGFKTTNPALDHIIRHRQKTFNELVKNELNALFTATSNIGINVALLKGLALAEDLYAKPELRLFFDIDILVERKNLSKLLGIAKNLSYTNEFLTNTETMLNGIKAMEHEESHHFDPLVKHIKHNNFNFILAIEIHICACAYFVHRKDKHFESLTEKMLQNVRIFKGNGFTAPVLDIYDNILCLISHATKHFFSSPYEIMKNGALTGVRYYKIQLVLDIDLYIRKHNIDFDELLKKALEWDIVSDVVFIVSILRLYDKNVFEHIDINGVYQKHLSYTQFFDSVIDFTLKSGNLFEIIHMSNQQFAQNIISQLEIKQPTINSYESDRYVITSSKNSFAINNPEIPVSNCFKTNRKKIMMPVQADTWLCNGNVRISDGYLYFLFKVWSDEFNLLKQTADCCLTFYFANRQADKNQDMPIVRRLRVDLFAGDGSGHSYITCREFSVKHDDWEPWNSEFYKYQLMLIEKGYALELGLRLDMLRNCIASDKIIFDMDFICMDKNNPECQNIFAWSSTLIHAWLCDVTTYGCLHLKGIDQS